MEGEGSEKREESGGDKEAKALRAPSCACDRATSKCVAVPMRVMKNEEGRLGRVASRERRKGRNGS